MLSGLFPDDVVIRWGDPLEPGPPLFAEEEALVLRAVEKRKREFAKGRECARDAMAALGLRDVLLLSGKDREPLWPTEITGSITHTSGLCAVAVASSSSYAGLGIDAEPAEPLEPDIAARVCRSDDTRSWSRRVKSLEGSVVERLVFSVKEAVYKCQFPISRMFLGFEDVSTELSEGTFTATLRRDAPPFRTGSEFAGRWQKHGRHIITGTWLKKP